MAGVDDALFDRLCPAAERVFAGTPVRFAYLFGSRAVGSPRPDSDVDVAVQLDPGVPADRRLALQLRLGSRLTLDAHVGEIDLTLLNDSPLALRGRVVRDRIVIYSVDEPARVFFESLTMRQFADFSRHADELAQAALRDIAAGLR
jgi:uncharacterized protein